MSENFCEEVGLFCGFADEVVLLTFNEEQVTMLGGNGYAIHSACCSKHVAHGCKHYGLTTECKSVFMQAEKLIRNNREW